MVKNKTIYAHLKVLNINVFKTMKVDFETAISVISYSLSNEEHYRRTYPRLKFKDVVTVFHLLFISRGFSASEVLFDTDIKVISCLLIGVSAIFDRE